MTTDCKGMEGKVATTEKWHCEDTKMQCYKKKKDCSKGEAKGDVIYYKFIHDPAEGTKLNDRASKHWHCSKVCKEGNGCQDGSLKTLGKKKCESYAKGKTMRTMKQNHDRALGCFLSLPPNGKKNKQTNG